MSRSRRALAAAAVLMGTVAIGFTTSAQDASSPATFEVASVKPDKSGDQRVMLPTVRATATTVPVRLLP